MTKISIIIAIFFSFLLNRLDGQNSYNFKLDKDLKEGEDYISKTIIFKVKPEYRDFCLKDKVDLGILNNQLNKLQPKAFAKKFPNHKTPIDKRNKMGRELVDLSLIYEIEYTSNADIETAINSLLSSGQLEYAVPHVLPKILFTPNDPMLGSQWAPGVVKAYQAWDIEQGDTTVVIGISDTGIDIDHPDLINSIKYNYYDPIDSVDNDNDGFVDNYRGWDFGEDDNNPQLNSSRHGTWVAGICAASLNNGIGVAGIAGKCKVMPLRIDNANGSLVGSYESIVYGSDHGCDIINCSWGGTGGAGQYGQDIINYATINNNTLVIAAAGNNGQESYYYPASYEYVLSVAGTDNSDSRWVGNSTTGSSYNSKVDIAAPAKNIYTTDDGGVYISAWGGTSFASPIVAGAAGLLKSKYPDMSGIQIGELLKVTSDKIDSLTANLPYYGKLGSGRLNIYRALTEFNKPSVVVNEINVTDKNNQIFLSGDTLNLVAYITNYLAPTSNMLAILSSTSSYVNIYDANTTFGSIQTLEPKSNSNDPFKIKINTASGTNLSIPFTLTLQDGSYSTSYNFNIKFNLDYIEINENKISTTLTSNGKIGWTDADKTNGQGFIYDDGYSLAGNISLMIGCSATQVSDVAYGNSGFSSFESDFQTTEIINKLDNPVEADYEAVGKFNDAGAGITKMNVDVRQKFYAWNNTEDSKYIIAEYTIKNSGSSTINNLYAGLYADWDMNETAYNAAGYDEENQLGYAYSIVGDNYFCGLSLLNNDNARYYAIDNDGDFGSISVNNGFSSSEKWTVLRTQRTNAGVSSIHPNGNDISHAMSSGPYVLPVNDSITIAFAVLASYSFNDLKNSAINAYNKYNKTSIDHLELVKNYNLYPNPADDRITLKNPTEIIHNIRIYNIFGQEIYNVSLSGNHSQSIDVSILKPGFYYLKVNNSNSAIPFIKN